MIYGRSRDIGLDSRPIIIEQHYAGNRSLRERADDNRESGLSLALSDFDDASILSRDARKVRGGVRRVQPRTKSRVYCDNVATGQNGVYWRSGHSHPWCPMEKWPHRLRHDRRDRVVAGGHSDVELSFRIRRCSQAG